MAICPFADYRPIIKRRDRIDARAIIYHTAVSDALSLYGYFSNVGDDSHFYLQQDGGLEQYVDTAWSAYANVSANSFAISVESWDGRALIGWSEPQLRTIRRLNEWLALAHPHIPRQQIGTPTGAGIGWHSMWGYNTPTSKPNPWTNANGKTCPGAPRIAQMHAYVVPWFLHPSAPEPAPQPEEITAMRNGDWFYARGDQVANVYAVSYDFTVGIVRRAVTGPLGQAELAIAETSGKETVTTLPQDMFDSIPKIVGSP